MDPLDRIRNGFAIGNGSHSHFYVACGSRHETSMIPKALKFATLKKKMAPIPPHRVDAAAVVPGDIPAKCLQIIAKFKEQKPELKGVGFSGQVQAGGATIIKAENGSPCIWKGAPHGSPGNVIRFIYNRGDDYMTLLFPNKRTKFI